MEKILVVEDDKEINRLICEYLGSYGYEMLSAANGIEGLSLLKSRTDLALCLLDLMLPLKSGDRVMQELRAFSDLPVIVLSAKDMIQTKIDLFRLGADDYLTKPFDLDELLMRVQAVLKRSNGQTRDSRTAEQGHFSYKNMVMDDQAKTVLVKGQKLELTVKEYEILKLLLSHPKKLFSKANLYESVWEEPYYPEDRTLKVHMSNLRNKIKKYDAQEYIETIWGMGYKLTE